MEERSADTRNGAPERLDAELELEQAQLETLLAHADAAVVVVEAGSGRVLRISGPADELLAASATAGIDAAPSYRGFRTDGRAYRRHEWPLARTLRTGETVRRECVDVELPDGSRRTVSVTTAPIRSNGTIVAGVAVVEDVTAQRQRERAERDFVTNAAHELQTPIAAITSAIEVLQAGAKERAPERDRFLLHIARASDRLARLTRALLLLARVQTGQEEPRKEVLQVRPLLEALAREHPEATITIRCDPGAAVIASAPLLEQALANLLENALKHGGGAITLAAERDGPRVAIVVGDDGRGIAPDARTRVFDRFYSAPTGRADGLGFGLGLAIVKEVVAALDGELELDTGAGGTRVSIALPGARVVKP